MKTFPVVSPQIRYARIAGVAHILVIAVGVLAGALIDVRLIVPDDPGTTAHNIIANDLLFRLGIIGGAVMYAGVLLLATALYIVLERVNRNVALLAMVFRAAEAITGAALLLLNFVVLSLLHGEPGSTPSGPAELYVVTGALLHVRGTGLDLVLFLLGVGGTLFSYLFLVSRYVPRALAAWGIVTYLSMLALAAISILLPTHPPMLETVLYAQGGAFEVLFGLWLLIKGVEVPAQAGARRHRGEPERI